MRRIKLLRIFAGVSQWSLSQAADISQGRYSMVERGLIEPSDGERERLARILQASASTLFRPACRVRTKRN